MDSENRTQNITPVFRLARAEDAFAVADLLTTLGYPSLAIQAERRILACTNADGTAVFVAEVGGRVIGVLSFHCIPLFHVDGFLGRITSLVVAPEYRKLGVGRPLVSVAEEFARAHSCSRIEVTSSEHRTDAHAFYEQLGFRPTSRRLVKDTLV